MIKSESLLENKQLTIMLMSSVRFDGNAINKSHNYHWTLP